MKKLSRILWYFYFLFIGCATSEDIARKEFSWGEAMVSLFFVMLILGGLGLSVIFGLISNYNSKTHYKKKRVSNAPKKNAVW